MTKQTANQPEVSETERLREAMDTVMQVLMRGELDSMRRAMSEQDESLYKRIQGLQEESGNMLGRLEKSIQSQSDELRRETVTYADTQNKALGELDERNRLAFEELRNQLDEVRGRTDARAAEVEQTCRTELKKRDREMKQQLDALTRDLAAMQFALQQQAETTQRFGSLVGNLAAVFNHPPQGQVVEGADAAVAIQASVEPSGPVTTGSKEELDDVLDNALIGEG